MSMKPINVLGSFMADLVCRVDRMAAWGETIHGNTFGEVARKVYAKEGMNAVFISEDPERPTGTASIVVDDARGENAMIIVPGDCDGMTELEVEAAKSAISDSALFISQLELPLPVCQPVRNMAEIKAAATRFGNAVAGISVTRAGAALAMPDR